MQLNRAFHFTVFTCYIFLKHNAEEMYNAKVNLPLTQQNLQGQNRRKVLAYTQ